jgi:hypothetical protein
MVLFKLEMIQANYKLFLQEKINFKFGKNELMNILSKTELTSTSLLSERNFQKMCL